LAVIVTRQRIEFPITTATQFLRNVIRNDDTPNGIRQWILDNLARWAVDREDPAATTPEPENA
jgi:hypothetical protein